MAKLAQQPHVVISSAALAEWLEAQPGTWWFVDGDPGLGSEVDFPCPYDELATAVRNHDGSLLVFDIRKRANPGTVIYANDLESFAQKSSRHGNREFVMQWSDFDDPWVLSEDKEASSED
jgi:hypothetical protein